MCIAFRGQPFHGRVDAGDLARKFLFISNLHCVEIFSVNIEEQ